MRRLTPYFILVLIICSAVTLVGCCPPPPGWFQGRAYEREPDGSIGPTIPGVEIIFVKRDGSVTRSVTTDNAGWYSVSLRHGEYWVTATHPDYEDYSSVPDFSVTGEVTETVDIFLRRPRVTTVLLVRHAEKGPRQPDDRDTPLSTLGITRAITLAHVAQKAGVTAIYATQFTRTQQTVQPLADFLKLEITTEDSVETLVNDLILAKHRGDVVLVASHSGSIGDPGHAVPGIIEALGGQDCRGFVGEYDNLYIVSRDANDANKINLVNLQYGRSSGPELRDGDGVVCTNHMTTILLVGYAEGDLAGEARGQELVHVVRKAGVTAIYATSTTREPARSLNDSEVLPPVTVYNSDDVEGLVDKVLLDHTGEAVVVAGDENAMSEIIRELGGSPAPSIFPDERDSLVVLTLLEPGDTRVLSSQYGKPSP
jgi:2,3-bisphosphoglycerate-dependent phosphoglycerate mutase